MQSFETTLIKGLIAASALHTTKAAVTTSGTHASLICFSEGIPVMHYGEGDRLIIKVLDISSGDCNTGATLTALLKSESNCKLKE
jgi:hypothetical protein